MIDWMVSQDRPLVRRWSQTLTSLVWGQWRLLDAQYRVGINLLDALFGVPAGAEPRQEEGTTPEGPGRIEDLERRALERVRTGRPPPREVYEAQNRARIDWSQFPEWARPIDPEVFADSAHEG